MGMPAAGPRELAPGTMLDDKYRVDGLIAVGGMGEVYAGTHVKLRKRVAIKVLNPQLATPPMIERFHREAITASQIGHEGIAQVTDLGTSSTGEPFLVMELLEGESLGSRLRTTGPMPIEVACELGCAILAPLAAAHAAGIVHRDLKPDNVFLVRQSRGEMVKLLDFGISRAQGLDTEFRLTTTGLVLGTPFYMSPEQAQGQTDIGPAADLYAFGVMLYEMLTGSVPIHGDNYNQLMYRVSVGDFAPPRTLRPDLPAPLEQIILAAMALQPAARPASAAQLEQALLPFCRATFRDHTIERLSAQGIHVSSSSLPAAVPTPTGRGGAVPTGRGGALGVEPTMVASTTRPGAPTPTPGPMAPAAPARPGRGGLIIGLVAVLLVVGGAGAFVALSGGDGAATAPAGSTSGSAVVAATTPTSPPTPTTPTDPPAPPPAPTPPATITVRFAVEPASANVTVDGKVVTGELTVPPDDATHVVEISAPGFAPHREEITFSESQRLVIGLVAAAPSKPDKPDKPGRGKKPGRPGKPGKPDRIDTESPYQ